MNNLEEQLEQQYMENEIQKILDNITPTEYKSLKEIEDIRSMVVERIYSEFMHYDINKANKEEAKQQLEGYECVEIDELKKGNYIKYFDMKIFYNLKLITGGTVVEVFDNGSVFVRKGNRFNTLKPNFFFRKVSEDALVKMKLLDIINNK
tara:strand:+ start:169 stop:618 length:450 start_codon:yes stop_codon:yes gene_type:complete